MALRAAIIPVTPFEQNCALLWDDVTMEGVVVDPGGDVPRILDVLKKQGIALKRILITHGHMDHAGGADELREVTGAPVMRASSRRIWLAAGPELMMPPPV